MKWHWWLLLCVVFFCLGCAITDAQIDDITRAVEAGTRSVVETGLNVAAPAVPGVDWGSSGLAGGLAAAAAAGVAYLTRLILKAAQKKPGT